jgi:hypothetical protein
LSSNNVTSDILFQEGDGFKTFLVHLDGSNEKLVTVTLVIKEDFHLSVDFVLSKFVPSNVVFGLLEFFFESLSVFDGIIEEFSVEVHNFCEFSNSGLSDLFVSFVFKIGSVLSIKVGLFQVIKNFKDGINSITSLSSGL